jgi:hypothetical protein
MTCPPFVDKFWQEGWVKVRTKQCEVLKKCDKSKAQVSNGRSQAMYAGQILSFPSIRKA